MIRDISKIIEICKKDTHPEGSFCSWFYDDCLFRELKNYVRFFNKPYGHLKLFNLLNLNINKDLDKFSDYAYWDFNVSNMTGIAAGFAYNNPDKKVFVNISDSATYCGNHYEAVSLINDFNINNILILIEYNNKGSRLKNINLDLNIYKNFDIEYYNIKDYLNIKLTLENKPKVIVFDSSEILKSAERLW